MLNKELKNEWLEKIKEIDNKTIHEPGRYFSIITKFYSAPEEVRLDEDLTWKVLLECKEFLWNIHAKFRNDKDFILKLINSDYQKEIYRGLDSLKKDIDIFKLCMNRGDKLDSWSVPLEILKNKELMLEVIPKVNLYENFKDLYKYDKEINKCLVTHHPKIFCDLPKRMCNYLVKDKGLMLNVLAADPRFYHLLDEKEKNDMDFIDLVLSKNTELITAIPEKIKLNREFIIYAIEKYQVRLYQLSDIFRADEYIAKLCLTQKPSDLTYLHVKLLENREVIKVAFDNSNNLDIKYLKLDDIIRNDKELMEIAIRKNYNNFNYISPNLKDDKDLVLLYCQLSPTVVLSDLNLNIYLRNDEEIMHIAIFKNPKNLNYAGADILNNEVLVKMALEKGDFKNLKLNDKIKENKELMKIAIKKDGINLKDLYKFKNDKEMVLLALETVKDIENLGLEYNMINDEDLAFKFIEKEVKNFKQISERLQHDKSFTKNIILKYPNVYPLLPYPQKADWFFINEALKEDCGNSIFDIPKDILNEIKKDIGKDIKATDTNLIKSFVQHKYLNETLINESQLSNKKLKI